MRRADDEPDAPARRVEKLTEGPCRQGAGGDAVVQGGDAGKRGSKAEVLVDFVGNENQAVLDALFANGEQFAGRKDFAKGIVAVGFYQPPRFEVACCCVAWSYGLLRIWVIRLML